INIHKCPLRDLSGIELDCFSLIEKHVYKYPAILWQMGPMLYILKESFFASLVILNSLKNNLYISNKCVLKHLVADALTAHSRDSVNRTLTYLRYSNIVAIQLIGLCRNYAIEHSRRRFNSNFISCAANKGSFRTRIPQSLVAAASYTGEYPGAELRRSSADPPTRVHAISSEEKVENAKTMLQVQATGSFRSRLPVSPSRPTEASVLQLLQERRSRICTLLEARASGKFKLQAESRDGCGSDSSEIRRRIHHKAIVAITAAGQTRPPNHINQMPRIKKRDCNILVDTGSDLNLLKISRVSENALIDTQKLYTLYGISDGIVATQGRTNNNITLGGAKCLVNIVDDNFPISFDGILGMEFLREQQAVLSFKENELVISNADIAKIPLTGSGAHRIVTSDDIPINIKQYRHPPHLRDEMRKHVQELLDNDIVEESESPYNSPLWIVPKKAGPDGIKKWRLVIDFRALNEKTIASAYPLPQITEILDQLGKSKYFSTLDLQSGFYQVPIDPVDAHKTAFSTPFHHLQFRRMPLGLKGSPGTFQALMDKVLTGLQGIELFIYMDDIVVYANSIQEHKEKMLRLMGRLKSANLTVRPDKCHFLKNTVTYLGHIISEKGVEPDPNKVSAVSNFPRPKNRKNIKQFLGLAGYYRRFVKDFAKIAKPLTSLLKADTPWDWTDAQERAFGEIKQILSSTPLLQYPDFNRPFVVTTDASDFAVGGILSQGKIGNDLPIAYTSRSLTDAEVNYSTIEKELLGIVNAVQQFRPYLYGRKFQIVTDHKPLLWLHNLKSPTSRLARWRERLHDFDYEMIHKPGRKNANADALSRNPHRGGHRLTPPASESRPRENNEDATGDSASDESDAEDEATFTRSHPKRARLLVAKSVQQCNDTLLTRKDNWRHATGVRPSACAAASTTRSPERTTTPWATATSTMTATATTTTVATPQSALGPTMRPWTSTSWATRSRVRPAAPLRIVGAEKAWTPKTMSQPAAFPELPLARNNVHQNAEAPASPDPAVNRGFAVDRLPVQADVNAWLRRIELQQPAPIEMPEQVMEWRVGRNHLDRMVLLRQPNPRFLEGERALGRPEDLLPQERERLVFLFDGFRPNFALVEACDHALLWAFVLPTGAWRGICCFDSIRHYPGLREVIIHKTGLKGALREQCAICPGCRLATWRVVGARHCDMCTRVIVLNQDAILSRRILESSPPDIRR
ncbi:unnamed protein product, partial [Trichogramma brassicae]